MDSVRPEVYSVEQLNNYIKSILDQNVTLKALFLVGEISNFKAHSSGHMYMTLKDEKSSIRAVMFRGNASKLKFMPENGMKVIVFGSVSVFSRDGQYQVYIENMQPDGVGALSIAFEQLKEKLEKEGLFDDSHKKPIPKYPKVIGVVTSETAAAFDDVKNVLLRRYPKALVLLAPAIVQGETAPPTIIEALEKLDSYDGEYGKVDVILLVRGGGSIEDLWCFNDESVARAIYNCKTPVISGIGHEIDFTIADFVSDLRAPTPSVAAELATPDITEELQRINDLFMRAGRAIVDKTVGLRKILSALVERRVMQGPTTLINERRLILDNYLDRMQSSVLALQNRKKSDFSIAVNKLDAFSPLKVLARGYSITEGSKGVIKSINEISKGDKIKIIFKDGSADCKVEGKHLCQN
ncbi:MAG: exodeoxyribonuclease VII large subunit [Ruminococcaceae bacterium]|nr:exodeoxyribonuclease VII large subunit [Oscillospiraceae bacterium]